MCKLRSFPHLSPTACWDGECRHLFTFLVPHAGVPKRPKGQALPETWIFIKIYLLGNDNFWHLCVILFIGFLCCFLITWITYFLIPWYLKVFFLYSYIFYLIFYTEEELNKCWLTYLSFEISIIKRYYLGYILNQEDVYIVPYLLDPFKRNLCNYIDCL